MDDVLKDAKRKGYAVGAFNFHNQDILEAIINAAQELNSPVIVQITPPYIQNLGLEICGAMAKQLAQKAKVPVVVHLDHGNSFALVQKCLLNGFTSVMFDGSRLPLAENIKYTKQVVDASHALGISVEGELGSIGGVEDDMTAGERGKLIVPKEGQLFVQETGVDVLAPAIGTAHGIYKEEPVLDLERLKQVASLTNCYLALHGGSGLTEEQLKEMIGAGINKVNVGTELKLSWTKAVRDSLEAGITEPMKIRSSCLTRVKEIVKNKISILGSENQC